MAARTGISTWRGEGRLPFRARAFAGSLAALLAIALGVLDGSSLASGNPSNASAATAAREHWAFQPVRRVEPPSVGDTSWIRSPVDRFILAKLEAENLAPAPQASREQLIRRVTYDLTGLPPTLQEIDAFVNDPSPEAYAHLIDRLLASPTYGERWGRHWLDVARFAETDGFELDGVRPHAWRYRDYVIRSFNQDKPYDRFIKEQLAGDELYPNDTDALVATAYNLLGPDMVDSADQIQRRLNRLNDMTDTTALAFLGLTLSCARCHDHKFEPLSQKDYFQFQAFFAPAVFRDDLPIPSAEERKAHEAAMAEYHRRTQPQREAVTALEAPYRAKIYEQKLARLSPEAQWAHKTPAAERTTEQINQIQETAALVEVTEKEVVAAMTKDDRARHKAAKDELARFPKPPPLPMTLALQAPKTSTNKTFVLIRGDYARPGEEVRPGYPEVIQAAFRCEPPSSSRAALAQWIASADNPLTARVMVNRIWQHHFGRGLVPSPSDFGLQGQRPSHPELLDWLASEFVSRGWSVKQMHRLLLLSASYQQSSRASLETIARDPENRLFSRWQRKRLEGEAIRDSLLAISGQLNPQMGGPGVFPPIPEDVFKGARGWNTSTNAGAHHRRSVYIFARRNLRFPFLEVFDAPDSNLSCPERPRSTSAPQSLTLLNAAEVIAASEAAAARLQREGGSDRERAVLAYRLILGRRPTAGEETIATNFLKTAPLTELCRALFNLNAFIYVE